MENTEAIGPNEVLALPFNIGDGAILPASSAQPTAAPSGAKAAGHGSAQWHRSAPCLLDRPEWQLAA